MDYKLYYFTGTGNTARAEPMQRPKAAVCVIDGGGSFQCADQTQRMLRRRGFEVVATARAGYADNWRQMTNPPSSEEGRALWALMCGWEALHEVLPEAVVGFPASGLLIAGI
ncbi:MAG: hypothetical protein ACOC2R_10465 [Spirochaetota bacterium]